jgi:hypothetical protein
MALGSLGLWSIVPAAWLWLTRDMSDGARFVLSLPGCAITMFAFGALLFRVEAVYARMTGRDREPAPSGWRRSAGEPQTRRPMSLLETFLVVSAVVALLGLVAWWTFFADASDPSGPILWG